MKNLILPCMLVICIGLQSCKNEEKQKEAEAAKADGEKIVSTECYRAIYEKDTVDLKLNNLKNGKVSGNMIMKVAPVTVRTGEVAGEFHGDTLFIDYTFKEAATKDKIFKNPMALLKRDKQLILGNGTMQTTMGVTYLVKDKPIDFERVKYKFDSAECAEKK
ncbi:MULTISPECIES: hypothetical protein [unclassified Flavobacterium]|jgi:hypothetical protein|uniref:hypothetical protein n=1 Tax=unclassified Flavobacterium TaxID=196869 RepID=UPI00070C2D4F|nr:MULTISPECIES: hypothetical protein [unclassified Flavobacterium]KRD58515.1 hypothetical protein ASE40_19500 [Flavobacterium sp. Root935]MDQ1164859.1 hypothetical protein [Flavobacterium sp. SORGH_AS_0622]